MLVFLKKVTVGQSNMCEAPPDLNLHSSWLFLALWMKCLPPLLSSAGSDVAGFTLQVH